MKKVKKSSKIILLSFLVLILSSAVMIFSKTKSVEYPKQNIDVNSEAPINYKYGVTYEDKTYGVKIEFPVGVKTYKFKEYLWPSHEHVYNAIFEKTFATENTKFNYYTGNFYLSYDNAQTLGDLISYQVYDIKNCNDAVFCQKYVNTPQTSGVITDGSESSTFWMRNDKYVIMFGIVGEDIKSADSKYKLSVF